MHVWAFTVAMFLMMWGADALDATGGSETMIVDGDDGTVRTMEDPLWPPPPR